MRLIRNILIGLVTLALLAVMGGFLLPRYVSVERDLVIDAPPEAVFPRISSLQAFVEWSAWGAIDPDMQISFSGPDTGVGNIMEWTSEQPNVGNGRQEIVEIVENESVRTTLDFGDMGAAEAWWRLVPDGEGTRVIWGLDADMGSAPVGRWVGLMMDRRIGANYERGLARLQAAVEG